MNYHNLFIYGKPVPSEKHTGRGREVRTPFSHLCNGEYTAVVGESHNRQILSAALHPGPENTAKMARAGGGEPVYLGGDDCRILPCHFTPQDFCQQALARAQEATSDDEAVCQQMDVIIKNHSGLPWKDFKGSRLT